MHPMLSALYLEAVQADIEREARARRLESVAIKRASLMRRSRRRA